MIRFRYQALENNGASVAGTIEAEDRPSALRLLRERGLIPARLDESGSAPLAETKTPARRVFRLGSGVKRKQITAFTREMASLLSASIPIPQALDGLGDEEENAVWGQVLRQIAEAVRTGQSFSAALAEHPRLFSPLYVSMIRVGEEAGELPRVMTDLAGLLEHEDEVRGEVVSAVAYPCFVLGFGVVTVVVLLTFVLPRLADMLADMLDILPLPTRILLAGSDFIESHWWWVFPALGGLILLGNWWARTPHGALMSDRVKLRLPIMGNVFRSSALGRFARTLGTMLKSGVSLLPALKIVEFTIGNLELARLIARVAQETRGGDSLATPLRKLNVFPRTVIQMIHVGEETGRLDQMLLKVAEIEERRMRAHTKTLVSLLAPALILVVGALVGFIVIALLLPIFKMSQAVR